MVETASQVAAREALKGKRDKFQNSHLENKTQAEGDGQSLRRTGARRGRYRQRRKRKDGGLVKNENTVDGSLSIKIMCALNYETCKRMVEAPELKSASECDRSDALHPAQTQEPSSPCAAVEMFRDLVIDTKKPDRKWSRHGKKTDLIRKGQSGWAGPGFDRSPSPSSLPMPPSELLERACQTDLSDMSM